MRRRTFLAGVAATVFWLYTAFAAVAGARIWGLWTRDPTPGRNGVNQLKGTLFYRLNSDRTDRALNTYGNGSDGLSSQRQCVELIKRYAAQLGFSGYGGSLGSSDNGNALPSLGDGYQVARNFANASSGAFTYVANGAVDLPKAGSVISIEQFIPGGHVGIVCNHAAAEAESGSLRIKLFDQNMPIDTWKEIRFTRTNGRWYGVMPNRGREPAVIGWASPTG